jgi:membrane protease YdiL (CAAX protease family)
MLKKKPSLLATALGLSALLLAGLMAAFYLELASSTLAVLFSMAVILGELTLPLKILERFQISPRAFNIYAHRLETAFDFVLRGEPNSPRPDWQGVGRELIFSVKICAIIFVPYIGAYYGFYLWKAHALGQSLVFSLNWPPMLLQEILTQIIVVAMPEELFYRGFLQGTFLKTWTPKRFIFGLPVGRAIILTNSIFALGHLVSGFSPVRLLTFFPGLLFSWIVFKRHNLLSAIIFHASCNLLGQILYASWFLK